MALMTPRGIKIRLELPWAFGLLGRLWRKDSRTDAFRVLKTCEAIETVPSVLGYLAAVAASLYVPYPAWAIIIAYVVGTLVGVLLTQLGLFIVIRTLGLLYLSLLWSFTSGYGLLFVFGLVIAWFGRGWQGPIWWILGVIGAFIIQQIAEGAFQMRAFHIVGQPFTAAETNFFNAYRLHADRLGITRDLEVTDAEIEDDVWRECLLDYAEKYPEAVARFPDQQELFAAIGTKLLGWIKND